jgi:pyruvate/2-oxoglutarate/acetoin dehydrogenase E1 component
MGIPGLTIIAQSNLYDSGELLKRAFFNLEDPVIFIENKALYSERVYNVINGRVEDFFLRISNGLFPTFHLSIDDFSPADAVIITYGGNLNIAMEAAKALFIEDEITVDIIVTSLVSPIPINEIISCIGECDIISTLEEGTMTHGWGSEIISQIVNDKVIQNNRRFIKFASADCPIPSNHSLENDLMPKAENIITNIRIRRLRGVQRGVRAVHARPGAGALHVRRRRAPEGRRRRDRGHRRPTASLTRSRCLTHPLDPPRMPA